MEKKLEINFSTYPKFILTLLFFIFFVNILFNKYIDLISFTNLFFLLIPNWTFVFLFSKFNTKKIRAALQSYLDENYNSKLTKFNNEYYDPANPNTKDIFELFSDKELLKDPYILSLKDSSNKSISLLVFVSAVSILFFLISTVFIMRSYYIEYFSKL